MDQCSMFQELTKTCAKHQNSYGSPISCQLNRLKDVKMQMNRLNCIKNEFHRTNLFRPVDLGSLCAQPHPSARDSFPLVTCGFLQRRKKGALAAVCTPTLKSASKKHQNSTPPYRSNVNGTLKVVKRKLCTVCLFSLWQTTTL